jgi:hypothetical protein
METSSQTVESRAAAVSVLAASIFLGMAILLLNLFRWTLVEWLTPFILPLVDLAVFAVFVGVAVWSLVHFIRQRKRIGPRDAFMPLAVNLWVIAIVMLFPFTEITTKLDFKWHHAKRMEVVSAVLDGKMDKFITHRGGRGDVIHLPPEFRGMSAGGDDIMVFRRNGHVLIFFFTYRGILDHFSGFIFSGDDTKPENGDFGGDFIELERLRPNWYWAAST